MIVVDSSAAVEWLLGLPLASAVGERLVSDDSLHAPALLDVEVAQVVRRYTSAAEISADVGERALDALAALDIFRYTHELLLPLIWEAPPQPHCLRRRLHRSGRASGTCRSSPSMPALPGAP